MKKSLKKLFAIALAAAMVMALCVNVMAVPEESATYSITINKDKTDEAAHTYGAYQLFAGDLEEKEDGTKILSNITWGANVDTNTIIGNLKTAGIDLKDGATAADAAEAISQANLANDSEGAQAIADAFAKSLTGNPQGTVSVAADAESGAIKGLSAGYYLVKDVNDVNNLGAETRFILEVVSDVTVSEKADVPKVEKKVKETNDTTGNVTDWQDAADYDIGDSIPYKLTGTLPSTFADFDTYTTYTFTDTLSAGLTPPAAKDVKVTLDKEDGTDLSDLFTVSVSGQTITVSLKDNVDLKTAQPGFTKDSEIIVTYNAVLNENAVIGAAGNPNEVYLTFSNNPNYDGKGDTGETPKDKVIVFTYKSVFNKVDADKKPLTGADFTLEKLVKGADGAEDTWVAVSGKSISAEGTTFTFIGLDAGDYRLTETTTPAGYNTIEPIVFTITAKYDIESPDPKLTDLTGTDGAEFTMTPVVDEGQLSADVVNNQGATLPSTGGIGTKIFYGVGAVLVVAAGVILISRKRASN